jgi:hypothetical protein
MNSVQLLINIRFTELPGTSPPPLMSVRTPIIGRPNLKAYPHSQLVPESGSAWSRIARTTSAFSRAGWKSAFVYRVPINGLTQVNMAEKHLDASQPGLMITLRAGYFSLGLATLTALGSTVISCKRFATSGVWDSW